MRRLYHTICWMITINLLSSCVPFIQPIDWPSYSYAERMQRLTALSEWQWRGGLLLSNTTQHYHHVNVYWRYQNPQAYTLHFIAPLGLNSARITVDQKGARLQESGQATQTAPSAEQLMAHYFGQSWPVDDLAYWVRGMPAPGQVTKITQDIHHHIQTLQQDGWHITYHAYQLVDGYALPAALTLNHATLTLHVKIQAWTLPQPNKTPPPKTSKPPHTSK